MEDLEIPENTENMDDFIEQNESIFEDNEPDMSDEIVTLISGMGSYDKKKETFILGEYCYACIARLEYLLKMEQSNRMLINRKVFTKCGEYMIIKNKLLLLFIKCKNMVSKYGYHNDKSNKYHRIIHVIIKIFTRLTFPINAGITDELNSNLDIQKQVGYQQRYKNCLINENLLEYLILLISDILSLEVEDRSELQSDKLELYLCLIRNVLAVPNPPSLLNCDNDLEYLHDRCILNFRNEGIMDMMVELANNCNNESMKIQYLLLQIFYHYFRLENATSICGIDSKHKSLKEVCKTILIGSVYVSNIL